MRVSSSESSTSPVPSSHSEGLASLDEGLAVVTNIIRDLVLLHDFWDSD